MTFRRLLDLSQPAKRSHNVEAITFAELARHRNRTGEVLEVFDGWPDDVQSDIDALIQELAADASYMQGLADAPTFDAFVSAGPAAPSSAATVVRAKLGLESNVGTTTQFCVELAD